MIRGDSDADTLTITRDDCTAAELREAATRSNDADATRRMSALASVLEGYKRCEAGKLCGMDRQTLRDWVLRYNAEGIAGLCNRIAAGPKPRLTPEQDAAVAELVRKGPDLAVDGVVRWRRVDSLMRVAPHGMLSPLNQSASPQLPPETGHRSFPNAVGIRPPSRFRAD
jgi:Winged helix-turn helix